MKHRTITPTELLPIGTKVQVGNLYGDVIKAEMVESSNKSGPICLHTIRYTQRRRPGYSSLHNIVPYEQEANYAFIQVLE